MRSTSCILLILFVLAGCKKTCTGAARLNDGRCVASGDGGSTACKGAADCAQGEQCLDARCQLVECSEAKPCVSSEFVCVDRTCDFIEPERLPNRIVQTGGSTIMMGSGRRLTLAVGAPTPMGIMNDGQHTLALGPITLEMVRAAK